MVVEVFFSFVILVIISTTNQFSFFGARQKLWGIFLSLLSLFSFLFFWAKEKRIFSETYLWFFLFFFFILILQYRVRQCTIYRQPRLEQWFWGSWARVLIRFVGGMGVGDIGKHVKHPGKKARTRGGIGFGCMTWSLGLRGELR